MHRDREARKETKERGIELDLEGLLGFVEERPDLAGEAGYSLRAAAEDKRDEEEPGEEAQVLGGGPEVVVEEVGAVEDGVVEDEGLGEEGGVGGALVLGVVEVGDAGGDLADLPAAEAGVEEAVAVLLLHAPQLGVDAEGLAVLRGLLAAEEGQVPHPGEPPVRLVQQRPELLRRADAAAAALDLALALLRRRRHGRSAGCVSFPSPGVALDSCAGDWSHRRLLSFLRSVLFR